MKMVEIEIRPARSDEARRLTEIAFAAKGSWGYDERLMRLWADELTVTPEFIMTHPVYCAVSKGEVVGFYALIGEGEEYELDHIWVEPESMGMGIGRVLFEHAVGIIAQLGGSTLKIVADPHAEGFYRRMGAVPVGSVPSRPEGRMLPVLRFAVLPSSESKPNRTMRLT
ncbi:GNAT family N-acetyltransferase [Rhodocaloribacter litoris]|uniref:GNAT family N-acetyltransferase n=1 Tax=Rhodocaloribacter litoris TaxID=2558931 RepID=UPI001E4BCFA5|nr:GNAT family N-acetyltransferase [Rhodocaloribacter litoris]QXD13687.1 GNAT family N-acetyltransferase [Rhodocaloribacter litoris]